MRDAEPVARLARRDHGLRRAAGALGVGPGGVEPEPQRDADGVRQRPQEGDGAVDAAAHRDRRASGAPPGPEDGPERVRERVDGERLAADRGRLEQRQPLQRPVEPGRVRLDDAVAVDEQPHRSPLPVPGRVAEDLHHGNHGRRSECAAPDRRDGDGSQRRRGAATDLRGRGSRRLSPEPRAGDAGSRSASRKAKRCEAARGRGREAAPSVLHPADQTGLCEPGVTRWVPRLPSTANGSGWDTCSLYVGVGSTLRPGPTHSVESLDSSRDRLPGEAPADRARSVQPELRGERRRQAELAAAPSGRGRRRVQ